MDGRHPRQCRVGQQFVVVCRNGAPVFSWRRQGWGRLKKSFEPKAAKDNRHNGTGRPSLLGGHSLVIIQPCRFLCRPAKVTPVGLACQAFPRDANARNQGILGGHKAKAEILLAPGKISGAKPNRGCRLVLPANYIQGLLKAVDNPY
jgi:hypothetical protein